MSVYYYEPFYNFDRFFDEVFGSRLTPSQQQRIAQGASGNGGEGEIQMFLKPK